MQATIILADYAQAVNGKLNLIGAGWQWCRTRMPQFAVGIIVETPYDETNRRTELQLELVDADGRPVEMNDREPLRVSIEMEVGRPPGITAGMSQRSVFAVNATDLSFEPGTYEWRLKGEHLHETCTFEVRDG